MKQTGSVELATLRFHGQRFEHHALDVECTPELVAYRRLVLECAKELWRRKYLDRIRLPRGFEDSFRLEFDTIVPGSAAVPVRRVLSDSQDSLFVDEFAEAAELIDAAIAAAARDDLLPAQLPPNVIPLFADFGRTLRADEVLYVRSRGAQEEAPYNVQARTRLANWYGPSYEDRVDVVGEVRMANVGPGKFMLQVTEVGPLVEGRFDADQEAFVLEALKAHREVRLRVAGLGEFSTRDKQMRRFARIDRVQLEPAVANAYDEGAPAIWDVLSAIGDSAPEEAWADVPADLSTRIDEMVYGRGNAAQ